MILFPTSISLTNAMRTWLSRIKAILLGLFVASLFLVSFYLLIVLNWSYSDGDRTGYLQKFSRKGWLCKTYEGELAMTTVPGVAPTVWNFSVWNDGVATKINGMLGKRVVLHYREYRGIPGDCFGETDYFVEGVEVAAE